MTNFKANIFETVLAILTLFSIIEYCIYFYDLHYADPLNDNPFKVFNHHPGIIKISIASLVARCTFIICFLLLASHQFTPDKGILTVYIISVLTIAFLEWYELYYGSTFYYGEVRDKQGLTFPVLASLMVTLVIWKINYTEARDRNLLTKLILTGIVNAGLYLLWTQVYEPWNLWQS